MRRGIFPSTPAAHLGAVASARPEDAVIVFSEDEVEAIAAGAKPASSGYSFLAKAVFAAAATTLAYKVLK